MIRKTVDGVHYFDARAPEGMSLYAIGDIHGCFHQLESLHAQIERDIEMRSPADWRVIHLGDYVDRGPESMEVLEFLSQKRARDPRHLMLAGNHDVGMLEFLNQPTAESLFVLYGGVETARSYGVELDSREPAAIERAHRGMVKAVPRSHVEFLLELDFSISFGDFFFCHAGIKPGVPLSSQDPEQLIWIRNEFLDYPRLHPKVIVHGHTPSAEPQVMPNRVNLDTGCYHTGTLTAIAIHGNSKDFFVARG